MTSKTRIQRRSDTADLHTDFVSRVASLETSYDSLATNLSRIEEGQENLAARFTRLQESIGSELSIIKETLNTAGRTNWAILLQAGILVLLLSGAMLTPVWITTKNINDKAQEAMDWQKDYSRNLIPSSAEPKIAAMSEHLTEVETQFRSTDELRNVQFSEIQRRLAELQNAQNEAGMKIPPASQAPTYFPHVAADGHNP